MSPTTEQQWRQQQRVRFDYTNVLAEVIGAENGLTVDELQTLAPRVAGAVAWLRQLRAQRQVEWMDLPYAVDVTEAVAKAGEAIARRCDSFVVLGIGGSALGAIALQTALHHPFYNQLSPEQRGNRPRIYVLDNIDPDYLAGAFDLLDLERTIFNVVTKSGSTGETMAQLAIVLQKLRERIGPKTSDHIVATTDASHGDLRRLAEREGWPSFVIPETVGGRFSVLSPVGLLPAAVSGVDLRELLAGAAEADAYTSGTDLWTNPAALNAAILYQMYQRGKPITVMMPYSQRLRDVADWFRQLWAESLGKVRMVNGQITHVGPTPIKALGVTDQHSQLQLYMEGTADKVIDFISVERFAETVEIPELHLGLSSLDYLGGHTLNELIEDERLGTTIALTEARRPSCTFIVPEVRPFTVGQLLYLLEVQTALTGNLFGIDPFNQPGVEASKVATYALLGRPGYERRAEEIQQGRAVVKRMI